MAHELVRVTVITATTLQGLAQYGESHKREVEEALMTWTALVEALLREHNVGSRRKLTREISRRVG
eukprot:8047350-Prorocentrum_lima.AAC.1